jgi:lipoprotein-anchoring transpeptidase ErfK/SrfK
VDGDEARRPRRATRRSVLYGLAASCAFAARTTQAHEAEAFVLPPEFEPALVRVDPNLAAGTIHVLPDAFRLYWTLGGGEAIRFAVGVGRPGLYHDGVFKVGDKREWPSWRPTPAMIQRDPEAYAKWADGMPGGPDNPLGARALYLFDAAGRDTYLRIHGTNDPRTIGTAVSNGCARLTNEHIVQLYDLVPLGATVVLHPQSPILADATG